MPVDRDLWNSQFMLDQAPAWPCPACAGGALVVLPKTFTSEETARSKKAQEHEAWDPTWTNSLFVGLLRCTRCGDVVAVAGTSTLIDHKAPYQYDEFFTPNYFNPTPPLFPVPKETPKSIRAELTRAWRLFWVDPSACANRIRACTELVLTELGVAQFQRTAGPRRPLSLHIRIERFRAVNPQLADAMMAVKWLGNVGSHGGAEPLTSDDLFDGLDLMEHTLAEVFEKRSRRLRQLGRAIISRKGRPKNSVRRKID